MKKRIKISNLICAISATVLVIIILYTPKTQASFEDIGMGARAIGMGNAFVGDADDIYSVHYNPAGMVQLEYPEFSAYYDPYASEKDYGTVGIAYHEFSLDDLYKESVLYVSYARVFLPSLYAGFTVKSLGVEYGSDAYTDNAINQTGGARGARDPLFERGRSNREMSYDLGMLLSLGSDTRVGLMLANLNSPDISLESSGDKVQFAGKLGVSQRFVWGKLNMDIIREKRLTHSTDSDVVIGYEHWLDMNRYGELGLRCGGGYGSRGYQRVSAGFSYRLQMVRFDYGFSLPLSGVQETAGDHKISMNFQFGREVKDEGLGALLEEEERLYEEARAAYDEAEEKRKQLEFEVERLKAEIAGLRDGKLLETKERELGEAEAAKAAAKAKYEEALGIAFRFYKSKLRKGISVKERMVILQAISAKYRAAGVAVGEVDRELKKLTRKFESAQKDYDMKAAYYKRMKERGAGKSERREVLRKLIEKYRSAGIDTSELKKELRSLEKMNHTQ